MAVVSDRQGRRQLAGGVGGGWWEAAAALGWGRRQGLTRGGGSGSGWLGGEAADVSSGSSRQLRLLCAEAPSGGRRQVVWQRLAGGGGCGPSGAAGGRGWRWMAVAATGGWLRWGAPAAGTGGRPRHCGTCWEGVWRAWSGARVVSCPFSVAFAGGSFCMRDSECVVRCYRSQLHSLTR